MKSSIKKKCSGCGKCHQSSGSKGTFISKPLKSVIDETLKSVTDETGNSAKVGIFFFGDMHGDLFGRAFPSTKTRKGHMADSFLDYGHPASGDSVEQYTLKGGLTRIATLIDEFKTRDEYDNKFVMTSGDLILGHVTSLLSQGQVMIKGLNKLRNMFGDDYHKYHSLGNWDFVYGENVTEKTFVGDNVGMIDPKMPDFLPICTANGIAQLQATSVVMNVTKTVDNVDYTVFSPYEIRNAVVNGKTIKIGIIGLSTDRKPGVYSSMVKRYNISGLMNNSNLAKSIKTEFVETVRMLKNTMKCQIVGALSEFGIGGNTELAELDELADTPLDFICSADVHEVPRQSKRCKHGDGFYTPRNNTLIVEPGCCGEVAWELCFDLTKVQNEYVLTGKQAIIRETAYVKEHATLKTYLVSLIDTYFPPGSTLQYPSIDVNVVGEPGVTWPGTLGPDPLKMTVERDTIFPLKGMVVAPEYTAGILYSPGEHNPSVKSRDFNRQGGLHRYNYSSHPYFPAIMEGTSHNFITDCWRRMGRSRISSIRGFRYTMMVESPGNLIQDSTVPSGWGKGNLTAEDIFNSVSPSWCLGRGYCNMLQLGNLIRNSTFTTLNGNPETWRGGWCLGWSGLRITYEHENLLALQQGRLAGPSQVIIKKLEILSGPNDVNSDYTVPPSWDDLDVSGNPVHLHAPTEDQWIDVTSTLGSAGVWISMSSHTTPDFRNKVNNFPQRERISTTGLNPGETNPSDFGGGLARVVTNSDPAVACGPGNISGGINDSVALATNNAYQHTICIDQTKHELMSAADACVQWMDKLKDMDTIQVPFSNNPLALKTLDARDVFIQSVVNPFQSYPRQASGNPTVRVATTRLIVDGAPEGTKLYNLQNDSTKSIGFPMMQPFIIR